MVARHARKADRVLAAVLLLFAAAAVFKYYYPHSFAASLCFTVTEAALVGGIADWFAVTALFRRPLGFSWHTALIPRNRGKMIEAIAASVQNELLSKESIKRRLTGARLVDFAVTWLQKEERYLAVQTAISGYAYTMLQGTDPRLVARYGQRLLTYYLREAALADGIKQVLSLALKSGNLERLLEYILQEFGEIVGKASTREAIRSYLERYKESASKTWWQTLIVDIAELTNTLNIAEAAAVLQDELEQFVRELKNRDHPLRQWLFSRLEAAIANLENDPEWRRSIAAWQQGLAGRVDLEEVLATMAGLALARSAPAAVADWAAKQLAKLWDSFQTDSELQAWVEERLKAALGEIIDIEHNLIAMVVKEAMERLSDDDLNRFVEDKAGEDLAWIRINGSVVGGLVGLAMFLFLHYIYDPYVVPAVRALFGA